MLSPQASPPGFRSHITNFSGAARIILPARAAETNWVLCEQKLPAGTAINFFAREKISQQVVL